MRWMGLMVAIGILPASALAETVVFPTGDRSRDVQAVRAAVAEGGIIRLKAVDAGGQPRAFDFGDYPVGELDWDDFGEGYVALGVAGEITPVAIGSFTVYLSLGNDVHLLGETVGGHPTTIRGGTIPIRNLSPRSIPGVGVRTVFGVSALRVEGVRFIEPALQSIFMTQLGWLAPVRDLVAARGLDTGIQVSRNTFQDVQPALDYFWYALAAVIAGPAGPVEMVDNVVRFTSGRWDADERAYEQARGFGRRRELWEGLAVADLNAPGEIARNVVAGVDVGLLVYYEGADSVHIVENRVELRPEGVIGIACMANHTYLVERNTVFAPGAYPDGMVFRATDHLAGINDSIVRHNRVVMDRSDWGAITFVGAGQGNLFAYNEVEGSAAYALGLMAEPRASDTLAVRNAFMGNRLARFAPRDSVIFGEGVHVFFDTSSRDNTLVGASGLVKDLGQDNTATGWSRSATRPSPTLPDVLSERHGLAQHLRHKKSFSESRE